MSREEKKKSVKGAKEHKKNSKCVMPVREGCEAKISSSSVELK